MHTNGLPSTFLNVCKGTEAQEVILGNDLGGFIYLFIFVYFHLKTHHTARWGQLQGEQEMAPSPEA